MNLNQLKYFCELARTQHYIHASEKLGISQPSLSKAITNLETELQVFLFEKKGRNIVLTQEGKIFYEYVEKALHELECGKNQVLKVKEKMNQTINIGFVSSLQDSFIPQFMQDETRQYSFYEGISLELFEKLKDNLIDIAFCSKPIDSESFEYHRILKQKIVVLVPDNQKWHNSTQVKLEEIIHEPLLLHASQTGMHKIILDLYHRNHLIPTIAGEASEDSMLAQMVTLNKGIALVTQSEKINIKGIKQLELIHEYNYRYIYLVYLKKRPLKPSVKQLIQEILNQTNQQELYPNNNSNHLYL